MRLVILLLLSLSDFTNTVTKSNGLSFAFEIRSAEKTQTGYATIIPDAPNRGPRVRIDIGKTTIWSDGEVVEVTDRAAKTHTYSSYSRAGMVLLSRSANRITDAWASREWAKNWAAYEPKAIGTSVVRGVKCNVFEFMLPKGGYRWHFGAEDHLLRREERLWNNEVAEYWNFRKASVPPREKPPRDFTSTQFIPAGPAVGTTPKWSMKTADGRTITSDALRGRVVIVDFWATWCGPCRASMPQLQKLFDAHRAEGLEVVGVTWRESGDAKAYAEKNGIRYPIGSSDNAAEVFGTSAYGIPLVYVIDRQGKVVDFAAGYAGERTDRWLREVVRRELQRE